MFSVMMMSVHQNHLEQVNSTEVMIMKSFKGLSTVAKKNAFVMARCMLEAQPLLPFNACKIQQTCACYALASNNYTV